MKLSFDKFERYELPQVTLCNPNSRAIEVDGKITITDTVGVLSNPKGMNLKLNFNAPHELSFDYYRHKSSDPIKQSFYDNIYEAIQTDRYIYLTDIGYFTIKNSIDSDEDNIDKKSISLKSCEENELATAEGLYLEEGTYYLHTENNDGLLDLFLPKTTGWTIGYIDPSLLTKPYFIKETEVDNGYNFLYTTIQDMFECIVEPDIIRRTVSVYSRVYYAEHHLTDIHIAKYNLLKHKTVEENDEDKYTALNVQGKDENLEIRIVNPTGKNVIYNFESRYSWMSPALQDAIERWQDKCESVEDEYLTLQQGYYNDMQNIVFPLEEDIKVLELQLKEKEQTRDTIIYGDYDKEKYDEIQDNALKQVNTEIQNVSTQISDKKAQLETEKNKIETNYSQPISNINSDCALDVTAKDTDGNTIFTADLLNELMTHIKSTDYVDEYMLVTESMTYPQRFEKAKELMDRAQSQLVKISSGQKTYSIDTRSFLFNKQFKHFSEQLCAGAIIYVETKTDKMEQLHLTSIDINFDDKSTNFTLGNKYDRSDLKALYEDALGQNSKSFSELKYIASIIEDQQKQLDYQKNWVADLRTLTLDNVLTSEDQAIEINNRGLIGRKRRLDENGEWDFDENGNPYFEDEQVKLINNTLVFTEDNWEHAATAVGKIAVGYDAKGNVKYAYGINGQVLIGELILGNNLVLTGTGAGIKIKDSNGSDVFYADDDGNLVLKGTINATTGNIGGWKIDYNVTDSAGNYKGYYLSYNNDQIYLCPQGRGNGSTAIYVNGNFAVDTSGHLYANNATITGTINANGGSIGGWTIDGTKIFANNGNTFISSSGDGWAFYSSGSNGTFRVGFWGDMYCDSATIKGHIEASSGSIANWTMSGDFLYTGDILSGGTGVAIVRPTTIGSAGAGTDVILCRVNGVDNFRVNSDGSLLATRATITGTINATSGVFSNCTINKTCTIKKVEANEGYVGNWHIDGSNLYSNTTAIEWHVQNTRYQKTQLTPSYLKTKIATTEAGLNRVNFKSVSWSEIIETVQDHISSDKRIKNSIEEFSPEYDIFFDNLLPKRFKLNEGTSDRYHTGFIAQDVVANLQKSGLTTKDFAAVCLDNLEDECNGIWRIRYPEFVSLNTWQIQRCKKRIADLENTVAELKTQIQTLTAG